MSRTVTVLALVALLFACGGADDDMTPNRETADDLGTAEPLEAHAAAEVEVSETLEAPEETPEGFEQTTIGDVAFAVPSGWEQQDPTSSMRVAQWSMPADGGEAGEMVLFRFPGGGGTTSANIERWKAQFTEKTSEPEVQKLQVGELVVTLVDVTGTYDAGMMSSGATGGPQANTRMLAAIVEGVGDPYFFKGIGPEETMSGWEDEFSSLVRTVRPAA